jgi:hypothetical protein
MKMRFYVDSDDVAARCRQSFEAHTPTVVSGCDALTRRVNSYAGVVLSVEPAVSLGDHWRITIDTGDARAAGQRAG